jgi:hypothetical protein
MDCSLISIQLAPIKMWRLVVKTGGAFIQNTQLSINVGTGRAGLWSGGF